MRQKGHFLYHCTHCHWVWMLLERGGKVFHAENSVLNTFLWWKSSESHHSQWSQQLGHGTPGIWGLWVRKYVPSLALQTWVISLDKTVALLDPISWCSCGCLELSGSSEQLRQRCKGSWKTQYSLTSPLPQTLVMLCSWESEAGSSLWVTLAFPLPCSSSLPP